MYALMPRPSPFEIGTEIPTSTERLTARRALELSGLDFTVALVPVINSITKEVVLNDGETNPEPKYFQVVREDTSDVLGIVEGRFSPIQNREVFEVADYLVGARIIRAIEIERGARCFLIVDLESEIDVRGDQLCRRAIIGNAHNGKYSAFVRLLPVRKLCGNSLVMGGTPDFVIKHTAGDRVEAAEVMNHAKAFFEKIDHVAQSLSQLEVTPEVAEDVLWSVPDFSRKSNSVVTKIERIMSLFVHQQVGADHLAIRGTAYGLVNAVCEFADFGDESRVRVSRGTTEPLQRFKSALSGSNLRLKTTFFDTLVRRLRLESLVN